MRALFVAVILAFLPVLSGQAQTPPLRIAPPAPGAAVLPGAATPAPPVLTPEICRRLAAQQGGVPAAGYQPGVDVYGRPVAPADLPGSGTAVPPITTEIELGHIAGGRAASGGLVRGYVTLAPDGGVLLNGEPLPREQEYGIFDLCREQRLLP